MFSEFKTVQQTQRSQHFLKAIKTIIAKVYNKCKKICIKHWFACVGPKGAYFENDNK